MTTKRHGDLNFIKIEKIPEGLKEVQFNGQFSLKECQATTLLLHQKCGGI